MVAFNLFPWRERERVYQRKQVRKILLAAALLPLTIVVFLHYWLAHRQAQMDRRIDQLQAEYQALTPAKLSAEAMLLADANHDHQAAIQFLLALAKTRAAGLCFTDITRSNQLIRFAGKTHSCQELTQFLKTWQAVSLFSELKLESLEQVKPAEMVFRFIAQE